jgi:hypothetical protein
MGETASILHGRKWGMILKWNLKTGYEVVYCIAPGDNRGQLLVAVIHANEYTSFEKSK